jgi:hypothetical protein
METSTILLISTTDEHVHQRQKKEFRVDSPKAEIKNEAVRPPESRRTQTHQALCNAGFI